MSEAAGLPPLLGTDAGALRRAVAVLQGGGLIGYPTETLYGLGTPALNGSSLARLASIKGRPDQQPIPVLIAEPAMLDLLVSHLHPAARALIDRHWPGALTLVLPARPDLPRWLVGPEGGVGVRVSSDPVALRLVRGLGAPLTATSANRSGEPPASTAGMARLPGLDLVIDGGPRQLPPSTVVSVLTGVPRLLRQGALQVEGL